MYHTKRYATMIQEISRYDVMMLLTIIMGMMMIMVLIIIMMIIMIMINLPMLRLLSSKAQTRRKPTFLFKKSKPCHVCIHWIAFANSLDSSQMSTHLPGFQSFFGFFVTVIITSSSSRLVVVSLNLIGCTGELKYDGLNGTRKIGPSYAKSVVYII